MKPRFNPFLRTASHVAALAICSGNLQAADFYWDSNGATTSTGGAGNWTTANAGSPWRNGSATGTLGAWVDGNVAILGGTAGAVTISSGTTITTPKISVTASNYSLSGGTVAFGGSAISPGIIDVNGSSGFNLSSNATGSLKVMATGSNISIASAAPMSISGSTNLTSFELAMNQDQNHLILGNAAALGTASSTVKLTKGVLNLGLNSTDTFSFNAWATELAGGTIRARFGVETWNGATSLSANAQLMTRNASGAKLVFSSTGTINLNANTLNVMAGSTSAGIELNGVISGSGNITTVQNQLGGGDLGDGTTTLGAANTFSGTATTSTNLGTLALNHVNALQNATLNTGAAAGSQSVTFIVSGTNTYNIGALAGSDALAIGANTISIGNKEGTSSFGAGITGTGGLSKTGSSSTQVLTAATSYTGATQITGGTLFFTGSGAVNSSSGITVNGAGAKLLHNGSTAISPIVTLTQGTLTGSGTVNTVNVGGGTGGIISNNDGIAGAALNIGSLSLSGATNINLFSNSTAAALNVGTTFATAATSATITANNTSGWTNGTTYNLITYGGGVIAGSGNNFSHVVNNLSARQNATWVDTGSAIQITVNGDNPRWTGDNSGNWNLGTTNNWKLVTGGTSTTFLASDDVLFDDNATGTRNIDINSADVAPNSTVFNNTTGAPYSLGSSGGFGISSGNLTKNNTGTVTISSVNTYTGSTIINGGSIIMSGSGTLGTGSALTLGGGSLDLGALGRTVGTVSITSPAASGDTISNGSLTGTSYAASNSSGNAVISANLLVSGSAGFTKSGAGTVTLSGTNTYTGTTLINGGSLAVAGSGTLGNGSALTLAGGSLDLGASARTVGAVSVTAAAASGDTLTNGSLTGTSYAVANTSGNAVISADLLVNGGAGFTKTGAGTATLSGANTYTGATTISAGTLKAGGNSAFSNLGSLNMSSTGVLDLNGYNAAFTNITSTSTNTVTTSGLVAGVDVLSISAVGSDAAASALFTDNGTRRLQVNLTSGAAGSWQATSNINNTYSGGLILGGSMRASVLGGTVGSPGAIASGQFGTGSITVNDTSQIWFGTSNRTLVNDVLVNSNAGNGNRSGTFRIGTNSTAVTGLVISGNINANTAEAWFGADSTTNGSSLLLSGKLTGNNGFRFFQSANSSTWTTTLNNATGSPNEYLGNTTINSAQTTLALGAANQIPNGAGKGNVVLTSGVLDLAGFDETINGLSGAGTVNNVTSGTANTLTLGDGDATNQNFSGAIQNSSGTLALTKTGTGIQILSGTNTYTGATLISAGTLQIGNGAATGTLSPGSTITNNGTLAFNRTGTVTQGTDFATSITGTGALTTSGSGTVILSGTNSFSGATTISTGELRLASATAIDGTSGITVNSGRLSLDGGITAGSGKSVTINGNGANFFGALQGNSGTNEWSGGVVVAATPGTRIGVNSGQFTVSGIISGSTAGNGLTFRPNNSTTLIISGANTYAGDTTIVSGTGIVKLDGGDNRLPTGTKLIFGASGVSGILDLNGRNQEIAGMSVNSGTANEIKSATSATLTVNTATASASTYAGVISGAAALTKTGSGTLSLTNTSTYTGATTVSDGTLIVNGNISTSSLTTVQSGATLGGSGTLGDLTIAAGGTHNPGNSPGIMNTGDYTMAGTLNIEAVGNTPGVGGYDQVNTTGTVNLSGTLATSFTGGTYANGDLLFILLNDDVDAINGTFSGLAQNAFVINYGGFDWKISYTANGDSLGAPSFTGGNDIALMAVPEPNVAALLGGLGTLALMRRRRTV